MLAQSVQRTAEEKFCFDCGSVIKVHAEICPKCGVRQYAPPAGSLIATTRNGKSKLAAALFAFFLGGIGVHKFYLGRIGWGIAYLLFCCTLIPSLASFIEAILLLVMSDQEFDRKYGTV